MTGIPPWLDTSGGTRSDDYGFHDGNVPVFTIPEGSGGKYLISWYGTLLGGSGHIEKVSVVVDDGEPQLLSVWPSHDDDIPAQCQSILDLKGGESISLSVTGLTLDGRSVVTRLG